MYEITTYFVLKWYEFSKDGDIIIINKLKAFSKNIFVSSHCASRFGHAQRLLSSPLLKTTRLQLRLSHCIVYLFKVISIKYNTDRCIHTKMLGKTESTGSPTALSLPYEKWCYPLLNLSCLSHIPYSKQAKNLYAGPSLVINGLTWKKVQCDI